MLQGRADKREIERVYVFVPSWTGEWARDEADAAAVAVYDVIHC